MFNFFNKKSKNALPFDQTNIGFDTSERYASQSDPNVNSQSLNQNKKNYTTKDYTQEKNGPSSNVRNTAEQYLVQSDSSNTNFTSNTQKDISFFDKLKNTESSTKASVFSAEQSTKLKTRTRFSNSLNNPLKGKASDLRSKSKDKVVSITYEEIGLFPRSFSRVFDRFLKQIFSDVENLVIQEYRFYRYLFLTTIQTIFILIFVPLVVNFIAKNYLIRPITEYFWNTKQTEIFLNSYEQKRAFVELQDFEEKLYFESLLISNNFITSQSNLSNIPNTDINLDSRLNLTVLSNKNRGVEQVSQSQNPYDLLRNSRTNSAVEFDQINNKNLDQQPTQLNQSFGNTSSTGSFSPENNTSYDLRSKSSVGSFVKEPLMVNSVINPVLSFSKNTVNKNTQEVFAVEQAQGYNPGFKQNGNQYNLFLALADSLQEKTLELAIRYNNHSIESITNFFADFVSLITLLYLLVSLEIQINITKSFLLEVFFGLDDSKKSLLILIMTDLLVGYHSSNLWELFFQFIFNHYGIPESQTGIFLLVATLPVLLDVLFKYLIFRHLNRSSPATVATYHAIIE